MTPATDNSEFVVGVFAIAAIVMVVAWRVVRWIQAAPVRPDPWESEVNATTLAEAEETCPRCSTPPPPTAWFCEHCGRAVGPYNNWMPYLNVFSQGEVYRSGTSDRVRVNALTVLGYLLISYQYVFFAPIYWFFLFCNLQRCWRLNAAEAAAPPGPTGRG